MQVAAFQGVAIFADLQVEGFTTDIRNNFISTVANTANVKSSFVRILLLSDTPGSVVVCWAVALPEDTTLTTQELSWLLSQRLDVSIVSRTFPSFPQTLCTAIIYIPSAREICKYISELLR